MQCFQTHSTPRAGPTAHLQRPLQRPLLYMCRTIPYIYQPHPIATTTRCCARSISQHVSCVPSHTAHKPRFVQDQPNEQNLPSKGQDFAKGQAIAKNTGRRLIASVPGTHAWRLNDTIEQQQQRRIISRVAAAALPRQSKITIAPPFFKMAQNLDLRCVLVPAPWGQNTSRIQNKPVYATLCLLVRRQGWQTITVVVCSYRLAARTSATRAKDRAPMCMVPCIRIMW